MPKTNRDPRVHCGAGDLANLKRASFAKLQKFARRNCG